MLLVLFSIYLYMSTMNLLVLKSSKTFSSLVEVMSQPIRFEMSYFEQMWLRFDWNQLLTPKAFAQKSSCTLCSFLLGLFCHFSSWRNNIPIKFSIFNGVRGCPNSCFHYYYFWIPYLYQSRQLSWMSGDHIFFVCYLMFFNFVIYCNYEKFGIYKAI